MNYIRCSVYGFSRKHANFRRCLDRIWKRSAFCLTEGVSPLQSIYPLLGPYESPPLGLVDLCTCVCHARSPCFIWCLFASWRRASRAGVFLLLMMLLSVFPLPGVYVRLYFYLGHICRMDEPRAQFFPREDTYSRAKCARREFSNMPTSFYGRSRRFPVRVCTRSIPGRVQIFACMPYGGRKRCERVGFIVCEVLCVCLGIDCCIVTLQCFVRGWYLSSRGFHVWCVVAFVSVAYLYGLIWLFVEYFYLFVIVLWPFIYLFQVGVFHISSLYQHICKCIVYVSFLISQFFIGSVSMMNYLVNLTI